MSSLPRFFVTPASLSGSEVVFDPATSHQIRDVLRLSTGDPVVVLDGSGWEFSVRLLQVDRAQSSGRISSKRLAGSEPKTKIVLYQALLKGSKFDWVLQKGTEVGVVAFVPITTTRTVASAEGAESASRQVRWQRIVQEAAEQAHRARLPQIHHPMDFRKAIGLSHGLSLLPWEGETVRSLRSSIGDGLSGSKVFSVNIFIGPEGGFTDDEVSLAAEHQIIPVSLGPRILRAETAGIVAAAAILFEQGDLGG